LTDLGYYALSIALVFSLYATILFFVKGKTPQSRYIGSAKRATFATTALVGFAALALWYALFTRDFQIEYVANYSNRSLSWFYTFAALWAGQAGSLLFWGLLLVIFATIVLLQNQHKQPRLLPYTMGVIMATTSFFLYLLVFKSNPFAGLSFTPPDGRGLNPLLQNPEMVFHPPSLYVGFVGFTIPFAFAVAALLSNQLDDEWLKSIRRWTLVSWLFLTIGNILGMQWAYVELGWGGYWGWDPVENSSLMPWLTGTAFLHSMIVQERKGVLKRWTISLVVVTFALTIFGTFVTRSGLISSVHAFGVSNLGPLFLGFLLLIITTSTILLIKRTVMLKGEKDIGSWTSKESSFLLNNILFLAMTLGVLIGVLTPTLSELTTGEQMTVGVEWFNRMATPIGIAIFILVGLCAALSWGKTSANKLWRRFMWPIATTILAIVLLLIFDIHGFLPLLSLAVAVFAFSLTFQDYIKGIIVHKARENRSFFAAWISLTFKHKRRYGGYLVHLGVLLFFLGIIGSSAFTQEKSATLEKGESITIGNFDLYYQGLSRESGKDRIIDAAHFIVKKSDRELGKLSAEKHLFDNFQPATEVGIRSTVKQDIYIILADYDPTSQVATFSVLLNPLVLWIWIGGLVMVMGTIVALLPDRNAEVKYD